MIPNIQFHFWPYYLEGWSPSPGKDGYCFDVGPVLSASRGWVRLRLADPFAVPRITNGNINAPCMMVGAKVADHILGGGMLSPEDRDR